MAEPDLEDAATFVYKHHKKWSLRGQFIADFAAVERSLDVTLMRALGIAQPNEPFDTFVLGRMNCRTKIEILRDTFKSMKLANEFRPMLTELGSLLDERNRISHASVEHDVPDAWEIYGRGGRDALSEAIHQAEEVAINYNRAGTRRLPMDTNEEMETLRQRAKDVRLELVLAGALVAQGASAAKAAMEQIAADTFGVD
jgi:hypothetical protein